MEIMTTCVVVVVKLKAPTAATSNCIFPRPREKLLVASSKSSFFEGGIRRIRRGGNQNQNHNHIITLTKKKQQQKQQKSFSIPMLSSSSVSNTTLSQQSLDVFDKPPIVSVSVCVSQNIGLPPRPPPPILVNGCTGKMGNAVIKAVLSAGLNLVPVSFSSSSDEAGKVVEVFGNEIQVHGTSERESILASLFDENPNMIVVDYTVPAAVNDNADLYCKIGVPFVMGTTGGDRERLYKTVEDSKVYAVISPQMGKQVVAFLAAMEIMAEQFPGAFSGYSLDVMESHQASKLDTSGTAKDVISCFQRLGVSFELDQVQKIRDPEQQIEMVGVPEEYVSGHAFHLYHLTSPDQTVSFEFQHNVCGRSIYAEGSIDAAIFLANKVQSKADKRIYNMIDVLREGNMR